MCTEKQKRVLEVVARLQAKQARPTLAAIAKELGYNSRNTVVEHLGLLEQRGLIARFPFVYGGVQLTTDGKKILGMEETCPT